ncbi:unnamed protein product [Cuscuta europaea]|uniref:Pentatricopeptide repeat-containing protein n=1 Tax=Cuscuta europaea TaxID=41803 RepID=A0A9P0Z7P1_CUSEU|nr:unnamed protein product [Cuscuta europaea]
MREDNFVCSTSMITGYMNQGNMDGAEDVFKKTLTKDDVVFNAMIEDYSKSIKTAKKAIECYIHMKRLGFNPTLSTFASLTGACSALVAFEVNLPVQGQVVKINFFQRKNLLVHTHVCEGLFYVCLRQNVFEKYVLSGTNIKKRLTDMSV